ncbi:MAG: hypothetical protein V1822_03160 [Candidatus Micrarchaeota archaeon]
MNIKFLGLALMALCLAQLVLGFIAKDQINTLKLAYLPASCHQGNDPNTCPILRDNVDWYIAGIWICALAAGSIGAYLTFLHKETSKIQSENKALIKKIEKISQEHESDSNFSILLKGLDEDEQKIMKEVYAKDGIGQNTLHIRTNISKAKLSSLLVDLEKKDLIRKVPEGKINRIYLKHSI